MGHSGHHRVIFCLFPKHCQEASMGHFVCWSVEFPLAMYILLWLMVYYVVIISSVIATKVARSCLWFDATLPELRP